MDWFEKITGFRELPYEETQSRLRVEDGRLHSSHTHRSFGIGTLEFPSLAELRLRLPTARAGHQQARVSCVEGEARRLHSDVANRGALFQVASQFNLLEMIDPSATPEHGVTRYGSDSTQGPACAIAAGAGTIYRNYLVPLAGQLGQRANRQIDCLADLGVALGNSSGSLWTMRNGYALCSEEGLSRINGALEAATTEELDSIRGLLRIGLQSDVEVTDPGDPGQVVSQAYCSALPVAYSAVARDHWRRFACIVLEATYEATLIAAVLNAELGRTNKVLLTRVGGGAFGNDTAWINAAMARAIRLVQAHDLDVRIVCYGSVPADLRDLAAELTA